MVTLWTVPSKLVIIFKVIMLLTSLAAYETLKNFLTWLLILSISVWLKFNEVFLTCLFELPAIFLILFKRSSLLAFSFFTSLFLILASARVFKRPLAKFSFCLFLIFSGLTTAFGVVCFFNILGLETTLGISFFFSIFNFGFFLIISAISFKSFCFFNSLFFLSTNFLLGTGGGGGTVFLIFFSLSSIFFSFSFLTVVVPSLRDVWELIGVSSTISIGCSIGSLTFKIGIPK